MCGGLSKLQYGFTALMCAAEYGRAECVRLLIDAGADKDAKGDVRGSVASLLLFLVFWFLF